MSAVVDLTSLAPYGRIENSVADVSRRQMPVQTTGKNSINYSYPTLEQDAIRKKCASVPRCV